jgi:hypothetical protein
MMEEVTLLAAHCCMIPALQGGPDDPIPTPCKVKTYKSKFTAKFGEGECPIKSGVGMPHRHLTI